MKICLRAVLAVSLLMLCHVSRAQKPVSLKIVDVFTDKARYAPGENVKVEIVLKNHDATANHAVLKVIFRHLGQQIGPVVSRKILVPAHPTPVFIQWCPPKRDYTGGDRGWIGDNPFIFLDTQRIRALGWRPELSIREGVIKTVEYLHANSWVLEARS